jgi:ribulose-phosphate 3-epimerase
VGVDGGINQETAPLASAAGAGVLVAGSSIFGDNLGVATAMSGLRASIARHKSNLLAVKTFP